MAKPKGYYTKDGKVRPIMGKQLHIKPIKKGTTSLKVLKRMRRQLRYARERDRQQRLEPLMTERYGNLMLYEEKDPDKLAQGSYKYIITSGAMAHTAFHTEAGLNRWLRNTGIKQGKPIKHLHNSRKLMGRYVKISMSGNTQKLDAFAKKHNLEASEVLSNGEYTRAYIMRGKRGNIIYYLNPNYPREKLPYKHE